MSSGFVKTGSQRLAVLLTSGALMLIFAFFASAGTALADGYDFDLQKLSGKQGVVYHPSDKAYGGTGYMIASEADGKVTKAKSSNKKVISVEQHNYDGFHYVRITCKKAGKATVSYKFKGKKHKVEFTVIKYKNPLKTFKVGKRNYTSLFKKGLYTTTEQGISGKLKLKAAKGWKISKVQAWTGDSYKLKKVKIGKKLPKDTHEVYVTMKHSASNTKVVLTLSSNVYED